MADFGDFDLDTREDFFGDVEHEEDAPAPAAAPLLRPALVQEEVEQQVLIPPAASSLGSTAGDPAGAGLGDGLGDFGFAAAEPDPFGSPTAHERPVAADPFGLPDPPPPTSAASPRCATHTATRACMHANMPARVCSGLPNCVHVQMAHILCVHAARP